VRKPYFRVHEGDPPPLRRTISRKVRFEEVDLLGIVWHGRYPSYFEDARVAVGEAYGVGYPDYRAHQVLAPIMVLHADYQRPLLFGEEFSIEGILHWSDAARVNFEYVLRDAQGRVTTTGYSVQLLMDRHGEVLVVAPPFLQQVRERWRAGELG
jgi:acyl-CoA thioester hydrolase